MYFLNMHSLFNLKFCFTELRARERQGVTGAILGLELKSKALNAFTE